MLTRPTTCNLSGNLVQNYLCESISQELVLVLHLMRACAPCLNVDWSMGSIGKGSTELTRYAGLLRGVEAFGQ